MENRTCFSFSYIARHQWHTVVGVPIIILATLYTYNIWFQSQQSNSSSTAAAGATTTYSSNSTLIYVIRCICCTEPFRGWCTLNTEHVRDHKLAPLVRLPAFDSLLIPTFCPTELASYGSCPVARSQQLQVIATGKSNSARPISPPVSPYCVSVWHLLLTTHTALRPGRYPICTHDD